MKLIDADKLETTAVLGVKLQHADSRYYYFYEEETIEKAPTVDAIPIAWIELFMKKYWHIGDSEHKVLNFMVTEWKKWEKENE